MRRFALAMITISLAACSGDGRDGDVEDDENVRAETVAKGGDGVSAAADEGSMGARQVSLETELYNFAYSYPREAGSRQGLRMVLDRRLEEGRTALVIMAREAKAAAEEDGMSFRPHAAGTTWRVVAKPDGWLSLLAEIYTYYGGAHPNYGYDSLVWSDAEKKSFAPVALFASPTALSDAIRAPFCKQLDEEREERRGQPVDQESDELFDRCIDPVEDAVILLDSSDGEAFDRIRIEVPPYAAGPYAEGSFAFDLPVTAKVLAAVKPAYRSAFALFEKKDADGAGGEDETDN